MARLALAASSDDFEGNLVVCGIAIVTRRLENAGRSFHATFENSSASGEDRPKAPSSPADIADDKSDKDDSKWGEKHKNDKKARNGGGGAPTKLKKLIDGPNLYVALGLEDTCSMEAIKKAYRRLALEYHPDKSQSKAKISPCESSSSLNDADCKTFPKRAVSLIGLSDAEMFLLIQDAYETLSDPNLRLQYNSALPFDESIPAASDVIDDDSFYAVFEPVFNRNARWSFKKPNCKLGDANTRMRDVHRFYSFWWNFETMRDYSVNDEYDIADAECREERRWMERQNAKIRKKYLKAEKERINKLTDLAFSLDPRVRAEKEAEKRRKEEMRDAKRREAEAKVEAQKAEETRRLEIEEEKKRAQAEILRKLVEERKEAKAEMKKNRQRLRAACSCSVENGYLDVDELQTVCLTTQIDQLETLSIQLEALLANDDGPQTIAKIVKAFLIEQSKKDDQNKKKNSDEQKQPQQIKSPTKAEIEWSQSELSSLAKGLQKYPGGTPRRWFLISQMIGTKSVDHVINKTKEMADGSSLKSMGSKLSLTAFNQFVKCQTDGALKKINSPIDERDVADLAPSLVPVVTTTTTTTVQTPITTSSPSLNASTTLINNASVWSEEQQKHFETSLKKYPATMPPKERWIAIAKDVSGKTPKDCLTRFKEIRNAIMKNR